jgi:rod shape determining protein RodA
MAIFSSLHENGEFSQQVLFYKQIIWVIVSWFFLLVFTYINYRAYFDIAYIVYGINIVLLVIANVFGHTAMGATRWINIGGFNFQPSEVSKIAIIFLLARFFASGGRRGFFKDFFVPLVFIGFNALIIMKQPDLGTALLLLFIFLIMGFCSSLPKRYFVGLLIISILGAPFVFNHLKDYQKKRLTVFVNPNADPLGAGYTIIQSKISIGSGGFAGKGFLAGTQNQFNFLPERHTDFIFTVMGEEGGFLGSMFLLFLYWLLISTIFGQVDRIHDPFGKYLALGISAMFFLHVFINMGMTLGILPVVGVPLLCMSYGGTHVMVTFILVGIFFNIYRSSH